MCFCFIEHDKKLSNIVTLTDWFLGLAVRHYDVSIHLQVLGIVISGNHPARIADLHLGRVCTSWRVKTKVLVVSSFWDSVSQRKETKEITSVGRESANLN